jgi:hypothetical protein
MADSNEKASEPKAWHAPASLACAILALTLAVLASVGLPPELALLAAVPALIFGDNGLREQDQPRNAAAVIGFWLAVVAIPLGFVVATVS